MPATISRYQKKISGPILDRIDMHLNIPAVKVEKLTLDAPVKPSESSTEIRQRVQAARDIQTQRFKTSNICNNAEMKAKDIKTFCHLSESAVTLLKQAVSQMGLSARSYYRIIRVSRTIADLDKKVTIELNHVAEALQYRIKREE